MKVDYNQISKKYDNVRSADLKLIGLLVEHMEINSDTKILDFGCGTGNYADTLQKVTGANVFGVEPSEGMREKAMSKNTNLNIVEGNHTSIPFDDSVFDYVYMTDVIHHIDDIGSMFKEFNRIIRSNGRVCIATESHEQIDNRFYVEYFPATAMVDKQRYPSIDSIKDSALSNGFKFVGVVAHDDDKEVTVGSEFLKLVEQKGYSMFHLICDSEYAHGLSKLRMDLANGERVMTTSGGTMVWFEKE